MDIDTLEALRGSILKWENMLTGGPENGALNCPLCSIFMNDDCNGCPVNDITDSGCSNKEWKYWYLHQAAFHVKDENIDDPRYVQCPYCAELVKRELIFLKALLPKE